MASVDLEWLFRIPSVASSSTTFIIVSMLTLLGGFMCYLYRPYWKVRKIPGPPLVPLVGHLPLLSKYGFDIFASLAKQYGPVYRFHMGRQPLVIISDPELLKEVGIKKFKNIPNRSIPTPIKASSIHQKGLFFSRDTQWSTVRNNVLPFFQSSHISNLLPQMHSFIESATQNLDSEEEINFSELSLKIATDVVGETAFGINFGLSNPHSAHHDSGASDQVTEFINQHIYNTTILAKDMSGSLSIIISQLVPFLQEPVKQILKRIPGSTDWKIEHSNKYLSGHLHKIIERRMKDKVMTSNDFLSLVLNARESKATSKKDFTPDYITALTYEQLLAGSTTISFTMAGVVYLVAGHPLVEEKLLQEIDAFGPKEQKPTSQDLHDKFPYLEQVINEALRFYTASPLITRETSTDVEIGGYLLPKGTWVWLALGALSKDPKQFLEPEKFKPERFDPECEEMKQRHPYAFLPFGIGPRICIGQKYSMQELKLALIHLYRNYVFRHSPTMENPIALDYGIILNFKYGVRVRAIKRT